MTTKFKLQKILLLIIFISLLGIIGYNGNTAIATPGSLEGDITEEDNTTTEEHVHDYDPNVCNAICSGCPEVMTGHVGETLTEYSGGGGQHLAIDYCSACGGFISGGWDDCSPCPHGICTVCGGGCSECDSGGSSGDDDTDCCGYCDSYSSCSCSWSYCGSCYTTYCTEHSSCNCDDSSDEDTDSRPSTAAWYWVGSSYWRSGEVGHSGTSSSSYKVSATGTGTFSFEYKVSSEASYDKLTITVTHAGGTTPVVNGISGNGTWQTYSGTLSPTGGYITINATYAKDGSVDGYNDCGYIRNISFTATHTHSYSAATCTTAPTCSCGVTSGSALGHSYTSTLTCNVNGSTDTTKCIRYGTGGCTSTQTSTCIHNISVAVNAGAGGTVSGSTTCKAGATVSIKATPNTGYNFTKWTTTGGTITSTTSASTYIKTGSSNITVTATFTGNAYTITYNINGGSGSAPADQRKYYGTALTLRTYTGTREGYTFKGWSTDKSATSATWTSGGTMAANAITANTTLYAVWTKNETTTYTVNHYQQNVDGETYPSTPTEIETFTGVVGVTITPVVKVYDGFTSPNVQTVTITKDMAVNYYYTRNSYTLTLAKDQGITSVAGGGTYKYGTQIEASAVVVKGYAWVRWVSSNTNSLNNSSNKNYTFTMPADDVTLTATSDTAIYSVTTSAGAGGSITPSTTVRAGENKNIIISVKEGYKISSVTINDTAMEIKENYFLEDIQEDKIIVVTFAKQAEAPTINAPVMADGMIPVRWNGENWVITTTDDKNWYNYNPSEGKWANVMLRDGVKYWSGDYSGSGTLLDIGDTDATLLKGKSVDSANEGSMFVWVPRYTYKISGDSVSIKWSRGGYVDFTTDGYIAHPGFNDASYLGGDTSKTWNYNTGNKSALAYLAPRNMVSGIWVAKYEASQNADSYLQFKESATSISNISIGDSYTYSKNMLGSNKEYYGLSSTGKSIFKSHLVKNSEWAAVSYLYKAIGQDNEYSVKQIDTGLNEYVSTVVEQIGAVNNRKTVLNGSSILDGSVKDVDVIRLASPTDTSANNFESYSYYKGNAITEISSGGTGSKTVTGEISVLPTVEQPFMIRTGYYGFNKADGAAKSTTGFRTTLLIK